MSRGGAAAAAAPRVIHLRQQLAAVIQKVQVLDRTGIRPAFVVMKHLPESDWSHSMGSSFLRSHLVLPSGQRCEPHLGHCLGRLTEL